LHSVSTLCWDALMTVALLLLLAAVARLAADKVSFTHLD